MNLSLKIEIFKEEDFYVAISPELNVSSFCDTVDEARKSLKEENLEKTVDKLIEKIGLFSTGGNSVDNVNLERE